MILETSRLQIRELTVDDAEFVLALVNEPSFLTHIGDKGVRTLDDARRFILDGPWRRNQKPGERVCSAVTITISSLEPVRGMPRRIRRTRRSSDHRRRS